MDDNRLCSAAGKDDVRRMVSGSRIFTGRNDSAGLLHTQCLWGCCTPSACGAAAHPVPVGAAAHLFLFWRHHQWPFLTTRTFAMHMDQFPTHMETVKLFVTCTD